MMTHRLARLTEDCTAGYRQPEHPLGYNWGGRACNPVWGSLTLSGSYIRIVPWAGPNRSALP